MAHVLIAFECSGRVRQAFRSRGHDAWSCDLKTAEDGSIYHIQDDALRAIIDGPPLHEIYNHACFPSLSWDLMIAHPPCDYLTVSGNRWFSDTARAGVGILTGNERRNAQRKSVRLVERLWNCGIPRIAIENPIGRLSTLWMPPTQVIQPTEFGEPFKKATCLWLRNLPPLQPTHVPGGDLFMPPEPVGAQAVWKMPPSPQRKTERSRTYSGIAEQMAEQWASVALRESKRGTAPFV